MESTRDIYKEVLEFGVSRSVFYAKMIELTYRDPYFFASYIEIIEYLESLGLEEEKRAFLLYVYGCVLLPLTQYSFFKKKSEMWTREEVSSFKEVIVLCGEVKRFSFYRIVLLSEAHMLYLSLLTESKVTRDAKNLVRVRRSINVKLIQEELVRNEVCWIQDTSRQNGLLVHKHTNTIILRALVDESDSKSVREGIHESTRTSLSVLFPETLRLVEDFARERNASLGRVALVRLKPHARVYRHYDAETWLQGRNRYHLVVQSPGGSRMTSGIEKRTFYEGDLFFFDNKKMHTAENTSDEWRTHLIFDMRDTRHVTETSL